jgi:hypothetical protein
VAVVGADQRRAGPGHAAWIRRRLGIEVEQKIPATADVVTAMLAHWRAETLIGAR